MSGLYRNARNNPVIICTIKQAPNIDPKFQNKLIFLGVGKLINELFNTNNILFFFCVFKIS